MARGRELDSTNRSMREIDVLITSLDPDETLVSLRLRVQLKVRKIRNAVSVQFTRDAQTPVTRAACNALCNDSPWDPFCTRFTLAFFFTVVSYFLELAAFGPIIDDTLWSINLSSMELTWSHLRELFNASRSMCINLGRIILLSWPISLDRADSFCADS